jgi:site-specific DNA-methyltransferase (adenine-specific)
MLELNKIYLGDCLTEMGKIDDKSIDLIATDLPYQVSEARWDSIIDSQLLFNQFRRILKDKGTIVMTVAFPFGLDLIWNNKDLFKYDLVWKKSKATNFANAKNKPMRKHENILVFSKGTTANGSQKRMTYNPQGLIKIDKVKVNSRNKKSQIGIRENYNDNVYTQEYTNYPNTIIEINSASKCVHETQKPVELFEWIIRTYSNEGDLIFDPCMGSGTTGIAAKNTNRNFIGFEKDENYFKVACDRIGRIN